MSLTQQVKMFGETLTKKITDGKITKTLPGSLTYLLHGSTRSKQSILIKFGKIFEELFKKMVELSPKNLELLVCGITKLQNGKKKDIDLLWKDDDKKIIYYRELKANLDLDTEKLPSTFLKVKNDFKPFLENKYTGYKLDVGILNWSVYNRTLLKDNNKKIINRIKKCENNEVKVDHFKDFLDIVGIEWVEKDFYDYFKELGKKLNNN